MVSRFFANFGLPRELLTDRGSAFISLLFHKLEELYKIKHLFTTSCHPQTDGMVERANKTIITALAKLLAEYGGEWEDLLGPFSLSYNITPHASTGVEPYLAMFGREGCRPSSLAFSQQCKGVTYSLDEWIDQLPLNLRKVWGVVQQNNRKAQATYAAQYDKKRGDHSLQLGDRVLWFRPQDLKGDLRKFAMPYMGPYIIVEVQGLHTAKIKLENEDDTESILVNVDQLSRCCPEFAPKATLDYSRIKKKRCANRKQTSLPQEINIAPFHHLTTLMYVSKSEFTHGIVGHLGHRHQGRSVYGIVPKIHSNNFIDLQSSQTS
ncbi:MAG: transposase family protein, partial [Gammaproteobacteria bacterium]|nr:transposase family protein [Gammaproteobacteria bacterium]